MRVFVDCDDTLVLWLNDGVPTSGVLLPEAHPYGYGADRWVANKALIEALLLKLQPDDEVVIWSGGGKDYAERWRRIILPWAAGAVSKDIALPLPGDLCIDDQTLKVACLIQTWQEYVE